MVLRGSNIIVALTFTLVACAKSGQEQTFLQAQDLASDNSGFDKNAILDTPSLADPQGVDVTQVQKLLEHTPYGHASFLSTYQSNGVRADDAVARAAAKYALNPLVFLVQAEVAEGLVGEQFYPAPPSRVEYVFQCGCKTSGACDPALAGFDVQVDCLGRALRTSLDQIAASGVTAGGWGPGVASLSADSEQVTPRDEATAALYQYMPRVGFGSSGNWLFWNIWQKYAMAVSYEGPVGNPNAPIAWVGDACKVDAACAFPSAVCATNYPGGMCTSQCASPSDCPSDPSRARTFCASFQQSGYCLAVCDPNAPASCRMGYACKSVQGFGAASQSQFVCVNM